MIEGDDVLVWCDAVPDPVAVRFGWHELAVPNLMNKEGLPAVCFRLELNPKVAERLSLQDAAE